MAMKCTFNQYFHKWLKLDFWDNCTIFYLIFTNHNFLKSSCSEFSFFSPTHICRLVGTIIIFMPGHFHFLPFFYIFLVIWRRAFWHSLYISSFLTHFKVRAHQGKKDNIFQVNLKTCHQGKVTIVIYWSGKSVST